MCAVSPVVHTSNKKKLFQFSCGCEQFHYGRSFGSLVINVRNHGEHYETPYIICTLVLILNYWCIFHETVIAVQLLVL